MHPFDAAASFLSAEGSLVPRQQQELGGAASSSPSPSRGTRACGENNGIVTCQDCRHRRANAHCCSSRGFVCPGGHVKTSPHVVPASSQQCSERQQTLAASTASTAAVDVDVDVESIPNKRPRRTALPSVAAAPTTTSSVDHPITTRFAREVSMDAVFRCVLLGGPEPEVAYYTTITIAGHVFRGVLYDAGPGPHYSGSTAASDTDGSGGEGSSLSSAGDSCLDLALGL